MSPSRETPADGAMQKNSCDCNTCDEITLVSGPPTRSRSQPGTRRPAYNCEIALTCTRHRHYASTRKR